MSAISEEDARSNYQASLVGFVVSQLLGSYLGLPLGDSLRFFLQGKVSTHDCIQRFCSMVLHPQWCVLCRREEEDLYHLLWDCEFVSSMQNRSFMTVGLVLALACNRGCCSMFENVLLNSHFYDKGSIVWQSYFFFCFIVRHLACEEYYNILWV